MFDKSAFGLGIATVDSKGNLLDTYFPNPHYQTHSELASKLAKVVGYKSGTHSYRLTPEQATQLNFVSPTHPQKIAVAAFIAPPENDVGPQDVPDAYLRLHLLSHRLVKPHGINLTGIFNILPNVAWTSEGPIGLDDLSNRKAEAMAAGRHLMVHSVDKFPRMVDYVVPSGVRIADASRVRLGAYLGEGTTVMHEGFVNFNAGCEGPNMIEGRISAGVYVKKGSDLGGGCSTMGTLSGGGNVVISIGENCLLGANSGLGIPLGNRCTIESGLYLTAGSKVLFDGRTTKAKDLAGKDDLLFRRNSQTGQIEAIARASSVELNAMLHSN